METNNGMLKKESGRIHSLDFLRVISIIVIILVHATADFLDEYMHVPGSAEFVFANIFNAVSTFGMPAFIMVSGALMLNEDKPLTIKQVWTKKIKSIAGIFLVWSIFYAVIYTIIYPIWQGEELSVLKSINALINGHFHMWFLFLIVGLYAITPLLRCFVNKEKSHYALYFVALSLPVVFSKPLLSLIIAKVPAFTILRDFITAFHLDFVAGYTAYYVMGWYIVHVGFSKIQKIWLYAVAACALIATIIIMQVFPNQAGNMYNIKNFLVFVYTIGIFTLIHSVYKGEGKFGGSITKLSGLSFGAYIIHPLMLFAFDFLFPYPETLAPLYMLVKWLTATVLSFLIAFVMSEIPFIKKTIRA